MFALTYCAIALMLQAPLRPSLTDSRRSHTVRAAVDGEEPSDSLASAFAAEAQRRKAASDAGQRGDRASEERPFGETGIREVVLRDGQLVAIPRRPPPATYEEQGGTRPSVVGLAFGALLTLASVGLLLAISGADAGA